ncbi:MAG TPA: ABC transporter substrate-binding protein [Acidimicrobiales bacterium]
MRRRRWISIVLALVLLAAACGRDEDDGDSDGAAQPTNPPAAGETTSTTADVCASETLEATEIGVTADEIVIEVMADVGSPLAPGLFQGSIDAVKAWAQHINEQGGLACREVVVREWDSKLTPDDTINGTIDACQNALAMVGTTSLFVLDPSNLANCPDKSGAPTGLPDIAERATEIPHQCNPTTYSIAATPGECPYNGGTRRSVEFVGPYRFYKTIEPNLHGIFLIPGDLPSAVQSSIMGVRAAEQAGVVVNDAEFRVSGRDEQASFSRYIQAIKENNSTLGYNGSNDVAMVKFRKEAKAQGVDSVTIWACSLACYTPQFLQQGGADVEGTYLWTPFVPLEEADTVPELQAYLDAVGGIDKASSWGVGAWAAATALKQIIDDIVATDGPNGITRAKILAGLEEMQNTGNFNANGIYGERLNIGGAFSCFVVMQVQNGEFVRIHPKERGKLDCSPDNTFEVNIDPTTAFRG